MYIEGFLAYVWESNLLLVKLALNSWVENHYFSPQKEKVDMLKELSLFHEQMETSNITPEILQKEYPLKLKKNEACLKEEEVWRMKSLHPLDEGRG